MHGRSSTAFFAIVLCFSPAALSAGSRDFEQVVKSFELHYQCKRTRIPMWGLAQCALNMASQVGAKALDVAIFEDQDFSFSSTARLEEVVGKTLEPVWQPIICVQSRRDGEQTRIYRKIQGEDLRLMILTLEQGEAVIVEARLTPATLCKWLENPSAAAKSMSSGKQDEPESEE